MAHIHIPPNTAIRRCLTWAPCHHLGVIRLCGICAQPDTGQCETAGRGDRRHESRNSIHGTKSAPAGGIKTWGIHPIFADFNLFTAFIDIEGSVGADIQNLLELTGIQQDLLDPVLGLVGSLGGMFTS
jgi:hypothetical protein